MRWGGRTDMFIPQNNHDEKIYAYDVNSLYPFAMSNFEMPVGFPIYFEGDVCNHNTTFISSSSQLSKDREDER